MAFGFFKKTITADTIFHNGHIFTQDPELPWADAVAVKDEAILGVGNFSEMVDHRQGYLPDRSRRKIHVPRFH